MKLLLQSDWQADNMTAPVKQAIIEFSWKGTRTDTVYMTLENMKSYSKIYKYQDYTPIGTVEFVKAFAEKVGVKLPDPIHATELFQLEGRKCFVIHSPKLQKLQANDYPVFVKPLTELKKFTGFVVKSDKDFDLYPEVNWDDTRLFVTDVLENIVSEWRCYVLNGKVFACVNYAGDPLKFPNEREIIRMIDHFKPQPISFSLDIALCKNGGSGDNYTTTRFIEINDAYALGYYGGDVELYTKMLDLRWKEITRL